MKVFGRKGKDHDLHGVLSEIMFCIFFKNHLGIYGKTPASWKKSERHVTSREQEETLDGG